VPELPEVETTRAGIRPHIKGKTLTDFHVRQKSLRWPVELPNTIKGEMVNEVERRGKYLLLRMAPGCLIIHLGMSGSLRIVQGSAAPSQHDHLDLAFDDLSLRLNDPRRFGSVHFHTGIPETHWLLHKLGPEPLGEEFSEDYLFRQSRRKRVSVKSFLMDSSVVVGVGNIYATEALFSARVRPTVRAGNLSRRACGNLVLETKRILQAAIKLGGTTLRDYVGAAGKPGYFIQSLNAYGREGKPCLVCGGILKKIILSQRSTVFCGTCQVRFGWS